MKGLTIPSKSTQFSDCCARSSETHAGYTLTDLVCGPEDETSHHECEATDKCDVSTAKDVSQVTCEQGYRRRRDTVSHAEPC